MKNAKILLLMIAMVAVGSIACAYKVTIASVFYKDSSAGCTVSIMTALSIANPLDPQAFTTNLSKFSTGEPCPITYVKAGA
ncbi:hypothetical protein [Chitinophaga sp. RAB17]|uniref:hypothetical protein n=1 Tax=Chitinophaga sp. RAB17 TaxID=3233049 RepID=UPI003F9064EF